MLVNLGETADLICVADANPIISGMFTWKWLVRARDTHTESSPVSYFLYLACFLLFYPFLPFITGLSKCTDAPYFTGSNYPSAPPLPAPHTVQIQKNSFHYRCLTKGHIRQCGVVSVSTDAFSGLTHPLAIACVPLSTCPAPPVSLSLWLSNP